MPTFPGRTAAVLALALAAGGCNLHDALFGFPEPKVSVAAPLPVDLAYREGPGGQVLLAARVNGRADVDFILDTGAPVSVLLAGARTAALGLDTSGAAPLGDPDNPATPVGVIRDGFGLAFGPVAIDALTMVVVPESSMPCRERFEAAGFAGVIGADLFRRFVVEIDPQAHRVRLHDPATWRPAAGAAVVPIEMRHGHPFVEATLEPAGARPVTAAVNLDTGMNRAAVLATGGDSGLAMPAQGEKRESCLVNGRRTSLLGPPVTVRLGGASLVAEQPAYTEQPNVVDGRQASTLGMGLFRGRRLVIDFPGRRIAIG